MTGTEDQKLHPLYAQLAPEKTEDKIRHMPSGEFVQQVAARSERRMRKAPRATNPGKWTP